MMRKSCTRWALFSARCASDGSYETDNDKKSTQYLYDHVRQQPATRRPFCLTVSLTHPHDPYAISDEYYDRYADVDIPLPTTSIPDAEQDSHSQRILKAVDLWGKEIPADAIKRARRAYYGACSYVDDQVGKLLKTLKDCRLDKNTIVIFSGDHGDMLGERNMWYKMSWFENSARVPFIINHPPSIAARRVAEPVSTMDIPPTLVDLVGGQLDPYADLDGHSLIHSIHGSGVRTAEVFGEYMGEGTITPVVMIRAGTYKYTTSLVDAPQLFDLSTDPLELTNLCTSSKPAHRDLAARFAAQAQSKWDLKAIHNMALKSQRQRRTCWEALRQGRFESWDFQPRNNAKQKYIRSHIPLDELELRARFPAVDALGKESVLATPTGIAGAKGQ